MTSRIGITGWKSRTGLFVLLIIGALSVSGSPLQAQPFGDAGDSFSSNRTIQDGIAAVVGDQIILISDVIQQSYLLRQQAQSTGRPIRMNDKQLAAQVLDELIVNKLLFVRAEEDSLEVPEDLLERQAEAYLDRLVQQAGSERALEQTFSRSMEELKADVRPMVREQLMVQLLQQRHFSSMKLTERDYEEFYRQYRDSLPQAPEQIELAHIFVQVDADDEGREQTEELARRIADSIRAGGDFAQFARRYSSDPGSAENGGEYGWIKEGRFVKEYDDAVAELEINEISPPVESKYGVHVIQLLDRRKGEHRTRHILLPLQPSKAAIQTAVDTLNVIRQRLAAGESFAKLAEIYSDDIESKYRGGQLAKLPTRDLREYRWIVDSMEVGEITPPMPFQMGPTESGYHILKFVRVIPPHALDLKEDREQMQAYVERWKQSRELVDWIAQLRDDIYWEIKYQF